MPLNIPGILVPFQLLIHPRLVLPGLIVKDIRHIDFQALRRAGYRGAVFDKDNCLTLPHKDTLVLELQDAWNQCRETFGDGNVLIVSNSAGTYLDAGGIQSESVSYHLQAPVLQHASFKPAYSCISSIQSYFSSLKSPIYPNELIIIGDRVFTDVVLANRLRLRNQKDSRGFFKMALSCAFEKDGTVTTERETLQESGAGVNGPLAILTTGVWERESMVMRWFETKLVNSVRRWSKPQVGEVTGSSAFIKEVVHPVRLGTFQILGDWLVRLKRG